MGFAFWRAGKRAGKGGVQPASRPPSSNEDTEASADPGADLRARARHRLIGAAALLLAVAIFVPMLLDSEPRPVRENIPTDIPSERTPFTPRLSLPPVPASDSALTAPVEAQPPADVRSEGKGEGKSIGPNVIDRKPAPTTDQRKSEEQRALAMLEGKNAASVDGAAKTGKFAVQAAAPASETSARELAQRLKNAGFTPYVEKVETKEGARHRVRVGPYATRDDAERARARLKTIGFNGNLVAL